MIHIEFKRLTEVEKSDIIKLMNNQLVRRQMPLLIDEFSESVCNKFITAKEQLWNEYGYGPWRLSLMVSLPVGVDYSRRTERLTWH